MLFIISYSVSLITKLNLKTLGREDNGMEMKLHTKAEYKEKTAKASAEKQQHLTMGRSMQS